MTLSIGRHEAQTPIVLAPMAGITNQAYRRVCREYAGPGGGFFVSEMVTTRALVERNDESMRLISFDPDETPRSVQLYGVDPAIVGQAVRLLIDEDRADHIDLNFGCPVPKVTRRGGGAALPWKSALFRAIIAQAVSHAAPAGVPVTVKMRMGIDPEHLTYLEAGVIAEGEGAAAVALHARTAAQYYSGEAHWSAIAELKRRVTTIPVLGNGDIFTAQDALRMVAESGCDGVVVGRGCLGRPWLFADLVAAFKGADTRITPNLGQAAAVMRRHLVHLIDHFELAEHDAIERAAQQPGSNEPHRDRGSGEARACRDIRKHIAWYLKGYSVRQEVRAELATVPSLARFDELLAQLDPDQPYPGAVAEAPRGRGGSERAVALPQGWLTSRDLDPESAAAVHEAELVASGG